MPDTCIFFVRYCRVGPASCTSHPAIAVATLMSCHVQCDAVRQQDTGDDIDPARPYAQTI